MSRSPRVGRGWQPGCAGSSVPPRCRRLPQQAGSEALSNEGRFWLLQKRFVGRSVKGGRGGTFGGCDGDGELLAGETAVACR